MLIIDFYLECQMALSLGLHYFAQKAKVVFISAEKYTRISMQKYTIF